jgi:glucose/mannose-6-phosphate isomerase
VTPEQVGVSERAVRLDGAQDPEGGAGTGSGGAAGAGPAGGAGAVRPAVDLDDAAALAALDPGGMLGQVASAAEQARAALAAAQEAPLAGEEPGSVVVAGMGGSGIAGDVLSALAFFSSPVPVSSVKGDRLPGFVGPSTLLLAVSYSGTTDETLAAVEEGLSAGARLVAVCSGGRLEELARQHGAPVVTVAPGRMPRAALWSLAVPVCMAASAAGVLEPIAEQVRAAADALDDEAGLLAPSVPRESNPAKQAALRLLGKLPVIWGTGQLGAVAATRLRTQCNENAKITATSAPVPESNHNDVMGLEGGLGPGRELVLLRDRPGEHERDARRVIAACEALGVDNPVLRNAGSGPPMVRLARLMAFVDHLSVYLGLARGVDPTPIDTIFRLKAVLVTGSGG